MSGRTLAKTVNRSVLGAINDYRNQLEIRVHLNRLGHVCILRTDAAGTLRETIGVTNQFSFTYSRKSGFHHRFG